MCKEHALNRSTNPLSRNRRRRMNRFGMSGYLTLKKICKVDFS